MAHLAEALRQVEGAGIETIGNVSSYIELRKRMDGNSTFLVNINTKFFHAMPLYRMLKTRHGERPPGHWVEMVAVTYDSNKIETVHAWIQRGASYFVATRRSTKIREEKFLANFEDDFGNVTREEIDRQSILQFT